MKYLSRYNVILIREYFAVFSIYAGESTREAIARTSIRKSRGRSAVDDATARFPARRPVQPEMRFTEENFETDTRRSDPRRRPGRKSRRARERPSRYLSETGTRYARGLSFDCNNMSRARDESVCEGVIPDAN